MSRQFLALIAFTAFTALGVLASFGLLTTLANAQQAPTSARNATAKQIAADLRVEVELQTPAVVQIGTPVRLGAVLVNRSTTVTHRVVVPGDGSGVGWREPHVFYTGQRRAADGTWGDLDRRGFGRCGMYDHNWHDDVRELEPGKSLDIHQWLAQPAQVFDLGGTGTYRLRLHYRYAGGTLGKGQARDADPGPMKGVPEFELISEPVEFEVVRGLELEVRVLREIPRGARPIRRSV